MMLYIYVLYLYLLPTPRHQLCDFAIYSHPPASLPYYLFPPAQPRPRVIPTLLLVLLLLLSRSPTLRIPARTPRIRSLTKMTIILRRRRSRRRRRRYIALRHILAPLILLLLLGWLAPGLMLLVLRWRRGEELLVCWGRDGVVLVLCWVVGLA